MHKLPAVAYDTMHGYVAAHSSPWRKTQNLFSGRLKKRTFSAGVFVALDF
jgi:hypothetical protein